MEDLKDTNSAVYQKLQKDWVKDLDDRQILSQVQFCLDAGASSCTKQGEYFIADFVFVKQDVDSRGRPFWDIVVADSKLSASTDYTDNQKVALGKSEFKIKSGQQIDINGKAIQFSYDLLTPLRVVKSRANFIKIYSDGAKKFGNITE